MPNPNPYVVSYSFGGFQANNPSTPLPGSAVDNELAGIATAVAGLIAALADIRRSDGALNNGIVTFDSFESGLQLLLDPTNGLLVAAAVATAQASATTATTQAGISTTQAGISTAQAAAAAASAAGVNLSLYLAKANNLAGLGSLVTSRSNLGLGTAAVLDVGTTANKVLQLDGSAKIPAVDGSQLTGVDILPVGAVLWFPATVAPAGLLKVNGALVSRTTYARLYAFAAGSGNIVAEASWAANAGGFSTGDLSSTFRLPDLRGEFVRGFDDGRGVDAARVIGSNQADSLKDHTHNYDKFAIGGQAGNTAGFFGMTTNVPVATASSSPSTGAATETRARNVPLLACIKY